MGHWRMTPPQPHQRVWAMPLPMLTRAGRAKQDEEHDEGHQARRAVGELVVPLAGDV